MAVNVRPWRAVLGGLSATISLYAIAILAASGVIGFVGIVVPHMLRLVIGPDHRYLLACSALFGAVLLLLAEVLARVVVTPAELPIGIVTALLGGPLFLWLLLRQQVSWMFELAGAGYLPWPSARKAHVSSRIDHGHHRTPMAPARRRCSSSSPGNWRRRPARSCWMACRCGATDPRSGDATSRAGPVEPSGVSLLGARGDAHGPPGVPHTACGRQCPNRPLLDEADLDGYQARLYQQLSGEQQRVQLARVRCQLEAASGTPDRQFLFLDEPIANLDIHHQLETIELARQRARRGSGAIAVLHALMGSR